MICKIFQHSPVFRISGDEFLVILEGEDYENRAALMEELNRQSVDRHDETGSTLAVGISDYRIATDDSFLKVFTRADERMYLRKTEMKKKHPQPTHSENSTV